jgi:hypothetical protein
VTQLRDELKRRFPLPDNLKTIGTGITPAFHDMISEVRWLQLLRTLVQVGGELESVGNSLTDPISRECVLYLAKEYQILAHRSEVERIAHDTRVELGSGT